MTVQTVPFALQNASHSAALFRQSASAAWATGGPVAPGELPIAAQTTPNMTIRVGSGRGKVVGTSVSAPTIFGVPSAFTTQGMYDVLNDATISLTIATSDPTNPRVDVAYIQVLDAFYSGASNTAVAGIVTGTPAASPVAPPLPSNAMLLGTIAVAANATSIVSGNISTLAVSPATLVGVPFAQAAGFNVAVSGSGLTTITFPTGRFTVAPVVTCNGVTFAGSALGFSYRSAASTATNFTVRIFNSSSAQISGTIDWTAIQMTSASASG